MGRPRGFESAAVLDAALRCFQLRGFEATSIDDLVQCTGLSRASLYNAFGDKEQLFHAVLDHYEQQQTTKLMERIARAASPREALREMFASAAGADEKLGCLMVNSGMELGPADAQLRARVNQSMAAMRHIVTGLLRQLQVEDAEETASILQAAYLGLRVLTRTGAARKIVLRTGEQLIEKLVPVR